MNDVSTVKAVCVPHAAVSILHFLECACEWACSYFYCKVLRVHTTMSIFYRHCKIALGSWQCTQVSSHLRVIAKWPLICYSAPSHKWRIMDNYSDRKPIFPVNSTKMYVKTKSTIYHSQSSVNVILLQYKTPLSFSFSSALLC